MTTKRLPKLVLSFPFCKVINIYIIILGMCNKSTDYLQFPKKTFTFNYFKSISLCFSGSNKLARGWHTNATIEDDLPDVNHIVFLIHGIGQLMYNTGGIISSKQK